MNKFVRHFGVIIKDIKEKGGFIAFTNALWFVRRWIPKGVYIAIVQKKHILIEKKISDVVKSVKEISLPSIKIEHSFDKPPIWFCWLQGYDSMPPIVQLCLKSIKANSNGHPIIFISLGNYREYITLPRHIVQLHNEKKIGHAHFADIIRTALLYNYGGCWIDSTIFLTNKLPEVIFSSNFFSIKLPTNKFFISQSRWSNFFMACHPGNKLMGYTLELFNKYLSKKSYFIDYFMMDYFMDMVLHADDEAKSQIDPIEYSNENTHILKTHLGDEYSAKHLTELCGDTYIHKLSWKMMPQEVRYNSIYEYLNQLYS